MNNDDEKFGAKQFSSTPRQTEKDNEELENLRARHDAAAQQLAGRVKLLFGRRTKSD